MAIQKIFRASAGSIRYVSKDGTSCPFINGKFSTSNKELEKEIMDEVGEIGVNKSKHPYIYVDENEPEIDTEALSPIELIRLQAKEEARKELLQEIANQNARALDAVGNVSNSDVNYAASLNTTSKQQAAERGITTPIASTDLPPAVQVEVADKANNAIATPAIVTPSVSEANPDVLDQAPVEVTNVAPANTSMSARLANLAAQQQKSKD